MSCRVWTQDALCGAETYRTQITAGGKRLEFCRRHWGFVLAGAPIEVEPVTTDASGVVEAEVEA